MYSVCLVKTVRRGTSDRSNAATDATFFLVVLPSTSSIPSRIDATRVFLPKLSYRAANLKFLLPPLLLLTWVAQVAKRALEAVAATLCVDKSARLATTEAMMYGAPCRRQHTRVIEGVATTGVSGNRVAMAVRIGWPWGRHRCDWPRWQRRRQGCGGTWRWWRW